MTVAVGSPGAFRRDGQLRINLAAVLSAACLGALQLDAMLGSRAILIFLACGGLLVLSNTHHSVQSVARFWYVLLLPAYCLASTLWSEAPSASFRGSLQLALTMIIAIIIAVRVPPRSLLRGVFVVMFLTMFASVLFGRVRADIGAWIGIFGSKNAFAAAVSLFLLASLATFGDRKGSPAERLAGLVGVILSVPLMVYAQSAGAIIVVLPGAGLIIAVLLIRWLAPSHRPVLLVALLMCAIAVCLTIAVYWSDILKLVLDTTGKDVTLTGRTDLWAVALEFISQRPLLGMGYRAFWVHGYGPAEALWAEFGIANRSGFHFHNMYLSNAVEIGIVGVILQVLLMLSALVLVTAWCLRSPSSANAFFAGYVAMIICTTAVEVPLFFQFSYSSLLVIFALIYSVRALQPPPRGYSLPPAGTG